jgi:hypothetical protein
MSIKNGNMIVSVVHTCVDGGTRPFEIEEVGYTVGQHRLARSRGLVQLGPVEVTGHDICIVAAGRAYEDGRVAPNQFFERDASCGGKSQTLKKMA